MRPPRATRERAAFALPAALIALVFIGVLAAGTALVLARDAREGADAITEPRALDVADAAVERVAFLRWDRAAGVALPVGASLPPDTIAGPAGAIAVVQATRLDAATIWFAARGVVSTRASMPTERRVGLLGRLAMPTVQTDGALTAGGAVTVSGTARIAGADTLPGSWSALCPPLSVGIAGVVAPVASLVCDGTCGSAPTRIVGSPPVLQDPSAALAARYAAFGDESWSSLASRADVTLGAGAYRTAPSLAGLLCNRADPLDWGDPTRAGVCRDHFPLVHVTGDLTLQPGSIGQGVLLVDGDLVLGGAATYVGLIVARGVVRASGTGNVVLGAILSADLARGAGSTVGGDTRVAYSRCALERSLAGASPLVRAKERAWSQLFE